ncbi:expressed unknown protein [Seminavis robusta]|uniref:Uncharacterized protein n=1 Tax=Seminavis robusta TaxID=568900 RepID=A0A9N8HBD3_9STRA|nr:expressed unknown protein [Seminavis robusta]|eukprot:Sro272_g104950.1 n/a (291) ;mRNA; f:73170-74042
MSAAEDTTPEVAPEATTTTTTSEERNTYGYTHLDDLDLPPYRIHATNRKSASNLQIPPGTGTQSQPKRFSLDSSKARSRSRSPSWRSASKDRSTMTTQDGNSSLSSLEEFVDPDILYDKLGFVELEAKSKGDYHQNSHSYTFGGDSSSGLNNRPNNLTPVSERMSEDTLEDVHAFSDLSANTNTRPSSSVGTGGSTVCGEVSSHVLEPLDEGDEDDLESDNDIGVVEKIEIETEQTQVILTNLENISLQDHDEDDERLIQQSNSNSNAGVPPASVPEENQEEEEEEEEAS